MKLETVTTDMIVGIGLVLSLLLSIAVGAGSEIQTTLAAGLVGYIGRVANEKAIHRTDTHTTTTYPSEPQPPIMENQSKLNSVKEKIENAAQVMGRAAQGIQGVGTRSVEQWKESQ